MTTNNLKRIYLSPPHLSGREMSYVKEAFDTNWVSSVGRNITEFELALSRYTGGRHVAAVSSGTAALHLSARLLGIKQGDVVFCSSLTFIASISPFVYMGAQPVFIDSEPQSWNMSSEALSKAFEDAAKANKLPKAVVVVNLYGQSADMDAILPICSHYNVPVIEDAAESLGAFYKAKPSGTFGRFAVFSFNGNKIITTSGGGALVSDDKEAIDKAKFLATQARDEAPHYQHSVLGYNYRMSNILAGIGRGQLEVLDERVNARRRIFQRYYEALADIEVIDFMPEPSWSKSTRWLTALTLNSSKISPMDLINALEAQSIEARPVWKPMHLQPVFEGCKYFRHEQDVSADLFKRGVCLPSGSAMTDSEQDRVIDIIIKICKDAF